MDPPVCRTCGKKHWSRICSGDDVALPVERNVTPKPARNVTAPVTPLAAQAEIDALTAEVAMLKRKLAEAALVAPKHSEGGCPECERRRTENAERVRKHRAKPSPA